MNSKRKVLVIGHTYIAPINRIKWLNFANKNSDFELKVLIPKTWPQIFFNLSSGDLSSYKTKNCEYLALDTFKSGNEVLYGYNFIGLIKLLRKFKPDLIHVEQGDNAFSYFQAIFLAKIFCRKAKFTFFTWVNWKNKWSLKYKFFWKFIEKFNLYFSDGAIVGNTEAKKILQEKKFNKRIEVLLQLGVDQKYFKPAKKEDNKAFLKVGYIGRFMKEKGLIDLIDAFSLLTDDFPNWRLVLIGSGKDEKEIKQYAKANKIKNSIDFVSPVSHEKVVDFLNEFEIFVLPSYDTPEWREQFGHVLIEAMSCKVPVIGSTGGQIPNVVGDAGLIFKQRYVDGLYTCLKKLMQDKNLRETFGENGYNRFKREFSFDVVSKKTSSFWKQFF